MCISTSPYSTQPPPAPTSSALISRLLMSFTTNAEQSSTYDVGGGWKSMAWSSDRSECTSKQSSLSSRMTLMLKNFTFKGSSKTSLSKKNKKKKKPLPHPINRAAPPSTPLSSYRTTARKRSVSCDTHETDKTNDTNNNYATDEDDYHHHHHHQLHDEATNEDSPQLSDETFFLDESLGHHSGRNMLHIACESSSTPLSLIRKIHRLNPSYARQRDNFHRYPLHVAAAAGASPDIIDFLLRKYAHAALMLDVNGKSPLHLAVDNYPRENNKQCSKRFIIRYQIAKAICHYVPVSVIVEDKDDKTALEYAVVNTNDIKLMKLLQNVSTKVRREISRRIKEDDEGHLKMCNQFPMIDPNLF